MSKSRDSMLRIFLRLLVDMTIFRDIHFYCINQFPFAMKKSYLSSFVGALAAASFLTSCAPSPSSDEHVTNHQRSQTSSTTDKLHDTINNYRKSKGAKTLKRHSGLDKLAYQHSKYMAENRGEFTLGSKNISHYGFENRARVAKSGYRMQSVAENVAGGKISANIPQTLLKSWNLSNKHAHNLVADWDVTGLGVYITEDSIVYATQLFATENKSNMALMDRMRRF